MFLNAPEVTPHGLLALLIVAIVVLPSITCARQWVLRKRTPSIASTISDCSLLLAATLIVGSCCIIIYTTVQEIHAREKFTSELMVSMVVITPKFLKLFFVNEIMYTVELWLLKASFLGYFFGLKTHLTKRVNILFFLALAYAVIGFFVAITVQFTWCRPLSLNWSLTNNCNALLTVFGITLQSWLNITADLLILAIALIAIYSLNLGHTERYALCFIALIGCVPIGLTTVRFVLSYEAARGSAMERGGLAFTRTAIAWGIIEVFFTVVVFCLPSFRVFLRAAKNGINKDRGGSLGYTSGTFRSSYRTTASHHHSDGIKVNNTIDVDFERASAVSQIRLNTWSPEWDESAVGGVGVAGGGGNGMSECTRSNV